MSSSKKPTDNDDTNSIKRNTPPEGCVRQSVVLDLVFEKLLTGLSTDIAMRMHRLMKTGVYPSSEGLIPKSREDVYPELYTTRNTTGEEECQRYSVYVPQRKKRRTLEEQEQDAQTFYGKDYLEESKAEIAASEAAVAADAAAAAAERVAMASANDLNDKKESPAETSTGTASAGTTPSNENNIMPGADSKEEGTNTTKGSSSKEEGGTAVMGRHVGKQPPASRLPHQAPRRPSSQQSPTAAAAAAAAVVKSSQPPTVKSSPQHAAAVAAAPQQTQSTATTKQTTMNHHYLDIWGKLQPKEPKGMMDCKVCGRQVNTLRYAPHLDKCMGIGTTVRAAALAASGFVPNPQLQQSSGAGTGNANTTTQGMMSATSSVSTTKK